MAEAGWQPKREAKQFEPPPWEREQFETLRQQREPVEPEAPAEAVADLEAGEPAAAEAIPVETPVPEPAEAAAAQPARPAVPEAQVDAMLIQLRGEEPRVDEHLKVVGVFGSAVAMFFGVCMLAWGGYAFLTSRGQFAAVIGALIVLAMGAVFAGLGLWFGWRVTNRGE